MVAFSRLQLAAALLEYDNDPDDPDAPKKSAYDSAIFAHLRRIDGNIHVRKQQPPGRKSGYLDVTLPSDAGTTSEKQLIRRSKASIDMLHNPFGGDEVEELEGDLEVDLASWGLGSLIPREAQNKPKSSKGKGRAEDLADDPLASSIPLGPVAGRGRNTHVRSASAPLGEFGEANYSSVPAQGHRRNTISNPLELASSSKPEAYEDRKKAMSLNIERRDMSSGAQALSEKQDTISFPSVTDTRAPIIDRLGLCGGDQSNEPSDGQNPFTIPLPPPSRASLFDPKYAAHLHTMSNATRLSEGQELAYLQDDENPAPQAPSKTSALDVKPLSDRRISTATFNTRDMLDDEYDSVYGDHECEERERRYSRLELMRPRILVMPSPLQNTNVTRLLDDSSKPREGFLDSTDGRPLPPGARSSHIMGINATGNTPVAANSFMPNPRLNLSASQLLFRNNLLVNGQRDVAYNDIDGQLKRASLDGEKIEFDSAEPEEAIAPVIAKQASRPAGKLYGTSLIDTLEARKAEMRSKQRVFRGDERPSMMHRGQITRSSTLIDPASLQQKPSGLQMDAFRNNTENTGHNSRNSRPLLSFDESGQLAVNGERISRFPGTRSVFGVDTIWEREMIKLKEIEEQERQEKEEHRKREEEIESKKRRRKKGKKGKKGQEQDQVESRYEEEVGLSPTSPSIVYPTSKAPSPALALPDIPVVTSHGRTAPAPVDEDSDNESNTSQVAPRLSLESKAVIEKAADTWVSDNEMPIEDQRKTLVAPSIRVAAEIDDSDEDLPLSVALNKLSAAKAELDDSDEDRPLSMLLLDKPKIGLAANDADGLSPARTNKSPKLPSAGKSSDEDDEDVPLGIRASRIPKFSGLLGPSNVGSGGMADDDDRPLSMHPAQIRKTQFQMFTQMQQQQQQQQMFMANRMAFAPPPSMMLMVPPSASFTPFSAPPMQTRDNNKYSSVDRWRHDVATEGQR